MWEGLRLFSPSTYSSLPGWMMPHWDDGTLGYSPRTHVVDYLTRYEQRYELTVRRPHHVRTINRDGSGDHLAVQADGLELAARYVVSATGTWTQPFWPSYPGAGDFQGRQLHAAQYWRPEDFAGQRVVVVGGGNSGAQILAEVSTAADTTWVTFRPPRFLPDHADGRDLFAAATARIEALRQGRDHPGVGGLGDVVMVESVRNARDRRVLKAEPMFSRLTALGVVWPDGTASRADAVFWCTGFRPALGHLRALTCAMVSGGSVSTAPAAPAPIGSHGFTWSGTASGPVRRQRRCLASAVRRVTPQPRSWSVFGADRNPDGLSAAQCVMGVTLRSASRRRTRSSTRSRMPLTVSRSWPAGSWSSHSS